MFLWGTVLTKVALNHIHVGMYACGICVCVCVCVTERQRDRQNWPLYLCLL